MNWNPSRILIVIAVILLGLGVSMLASTSIVKGEASMDDASYFIKRQFVWMALAVVVAWLAACMDYRFWREHAFLLLAAAVSLLVAVLLFGPEINGSKRWLSIGPVRFQPSEVGKFAIIVALAHWMSHIGSLSTRFKEGLLYPGLAVGAVAGLILIEPDFGTCMLVGAVSLVIMFLGGARIKYLIIGGVAALLVIALMIMEDRERAGRIVSFWNPEENPAASYQLVESLHSFILGGPLGVSFGNSSQKYFYLPEAHTDFILSIIGEELGLVTLLIVVMYGGILVCGTKISLACHDPFGRLLGMGITIMITMQAVINVGVVTGCLPTKGLPLPLISYGGTSLVMTMLSVGVLLSIGRCDSVKPGKAGGDVQLAFRNRARSV